MKTEDAKSIAIVGRQPALGIAELESLYGSGHVLPYGGEACLLDREACAIDFDRLGGSVRVGTILLKLPSSKWSDIEKVLVDASPGHAAKVEGKLSFGLSVYGMSVAPKKIAHTALQMKKAIKASGKSVRMVPHKSTSLGSAVVLYNKLVRDGNWELLVVSDGTSAYLAQTNFIQDIDAYAARDQARPKRDAKVGMLPPKLAQILINLAAGQIVSNEQGAVSKEGLQLREGMTDRALAKTGASVSSAVSGMPDTVHEQRSAQASLSRARSQGDLGSQSLELREAASTSKIQDLRSKICVLDPFCGTGVVLQEAILMGYDVIGTDIEPRMIEYSEANLRWLRERRTTNDERWELQVADATKHQWDFSKIQAPRSKIFIAAETFLGKPLATLPPSDQLSKIIYDANLVNHQFLQNIAGQIPSGTRLALGVPAWRGKHEFLHLPLLDHVTDMGYTRIRLKHVSNTDLIYHRENQVVARELLVLEKK